MWQENCRPTEEISQAPALNPDLAALQHSLAIDRGQGVLMDFRASRLRQVKVSRSNVWRIKKLLNAR
jgi:hypothetical protein